MHYESGRIARALAEHTYDVQQSKAIDVEEPGLAPATNPELDAMTDHFFLTPEGFENQIRYEAMINRALNHAIADLERLQAIRKGGGSELRSEITKQSQEVL